MTREEAIEMLKKDKEQRGNCFISNALDMAIKALEQEPCEDLINKRATTCRHGGHCEWVACDKCNHYDPFPLSQQPCEDCVSREALKRKLQEHHDFFIDAYDGSSNMSQNDKSRVDEINNCIAMVVNEPPVTPKEKTGHWIVDWSAISRLNRDRSLTYQYHVHCDRCGYRWDYTTDKKGSLVSNFCPNCGAKMVEPQESEG